MNISNISREQALNILNDQTKRKNLNSSTRIELGKSIRVLRETPLSEDLAKQVSEAQQLIINYDKTISNVLDKIINFKSADHFIVYMDKGGIKVETIDKKSGILDRIGFTIRKLLRHDVNHLNSIIQSTYLIATEENNSELTKKLSNSVEQLKKIQAIQPDFYTSTKSIASHAKLTTVINKILDLQLTKREEKAFQKFLIQEGKDFLEEKRKDPITHFENLTGIAIAATVRPTNKEAIIDSGGYGIFSTENERKILKQLLKEPATQTPFTLEEQEIVKHYVKDLDRSRNLNFMLAALSGENNEEGVRITAKMAFDQILQLEEGQSIFMDVGYLGHSMRAQFIRKGKEIEINLFDTSGALQFWTNKNPILLTQILTGKKQHIALSTSVSVERFEQTGRSYLEQVITMDSKKIGKLSEKRSHYFRYIDFIRVFRSINPKGTLHRTKHAIQKSNNCFAQRIRACEAHCLGIPTYRVIRSYSLEKIYDELWTMAKEVFDESELSELQAKLSKRRMLNSRELKEIRHQLNHLEDYPQNIQEWYPIFALINHNILKHGHGNSFK